MELENKPELETKTGTEEPELKGYTKTLILSLLVGIAFVALGVYLVSLFPSGIWLLGFLLLLIGGIDLIVYIPFGVIPCLRKEKGKIKESNESANTKKPPKALKFIVGAAVIVGIVVLLVTVINGYRIFDKDKEKTDSYSHSEYMVWSEAEDIVSKQLKSPSTAEFCTMSEMKLSNSLSRFFFFLSFSYWLVFLISSP